MLGQFIGFMFKNASPNGFISLRLYPDKGSDLEEAIDIQPIRVGDRELLDITVIRAAQASNWHEPAVFCPPVATFLTSQNAKTDNLCEGVAISVECDQLPQQARQTLDAILGAPTVVVESGGEWINPTTGEIEPKVHLHWRLNKPTATPEEHGALREARDLATDLVGADTTNKSIVHPIRWPGSWHRKNEPRLAKIVASSENEIDLAEAVQRLRAATGADTAGAKTSSKLGADDPEAVKSALTVIPNDNLEWNDWNLIGMATWAATEGSGVGSAAFAEWSAKSSKNDPVATEARWQHYKTSPPTKIGFGSLVYLARKHSPGWSYGKGGFSDPDLPAIQIKDGELSSLATRAEETLIAAGASVYQRSGALVRPIIETVDAARNRKTKIAQLKALDTVYARDLLGKHAVWQRYDGRTKRLVPTNPPTDIAATMLARVGDWTFPSIAGVISAPTMRPDGSLLLNAGYDEGTRLLLVEPPSMPAIPEQPTRDDAAGALRLLEELLTGFPFVDKVAMAVALSAIITPVVRGAFPVTPMHASRAPTAGSGKSYLWDIVAAIATGQLMPVMSTGASEEETEKRLGAALMKGQPLISIDNINGELGGDALCQIIERPVVDIRILGPIGERPYRGAGHLPFRHRKQLHHCRRRLPARYHHEP